ncbi:MAG: hypothetical protein AB7S48_10180 [Bacteroidales bacterium]
MEGKNNFEKVTQLFGENFIGPKELASIGGRLPLDIPSVIPPINYSSELLEAKSKDYLLILTVPNFIDGSSVNIFNLRNHFGVNPDIYEPCFYNQDWYLKEPFIMNPVDLKWVLVRKVVFNDTRAVDPKILTERFVLPKAITCCYIFFVYNLVRGEYLWPYDFLWCSDLDHNGDKIYVGKYYDVDGVNKNGFSIHRHLSLRNCYAAIDSY